jgi:hypothetical protein
VVSSGRKLTFFGFYICDAKELNRIGFVLFFDLKAA